MMSIPCGCVRGQFFCPKAVALWNKTVMVHNQVMAGVARYSDYIQATWEYADHFTDQEILPWDQQPTG